MKMMKLVCGKFLRMCSLNHFSMNYRKSLILTLELAVINFQSVKNNYFVLLVPYFATTESSS